MIRLDLTDKEREYMLQVLENELSDLRMEIENTDNSKYKHELKMRKSMVMKLIEPFRKSEKEAA